MKHNFETFSYGKNFLEDSDYHTGTGYMNGFFAYNDILNAVHIRPETRDKILQFKLSTDSKTMTKKDYNMFCNQLSGKNEFLKTEQLFKIKLLLKFISEIEDDELETSFCKTIKSKSNLAVYMGYDFIDECGEYVLLNRAKMLVDENAVKTFHEGSEKEINDLCGEQGL